MTRSAFPRYRGVLPILLLALLAASVYTAYASAPTTSGLAQSNTPTPTRTATANTSATSIPTAGTGTVTPTSTPIAEVAVDVDIAYGSGDFDFEDTTAGLDKLASYSATLTLAFNGTRSGQPEIWTRTYTMFANQDPHARQWLIDGSNGTTKLMPLALAELDGTNYEIRGETDCRASLVDEGPSLTEQFELALLLDSVSGADKAGSETINGVLADHYTFDQAALGEEGVSKATGELWVDTKGGHLFKYQLTREADEDYFGDRVKGTQTVAYQMSVPEKPFAIELPAACPAGLVNAPLTTDAANVEQAPGSLTFESKLGIKEITDFYQQALPKLGWTVQQEPILTDTAALLWYANDKQTLTLSFVSEDGGGTRVSMVLGRMPAPSQPQK